MLIYLFISIVLALLFSRKFGIGLSLLLASTFLGVSTFGLSETLFRSYFHPQTFEVIALLIFTYLLAQAMDQFGFLERISDSFNSSFGSLSIALIPLILGLIPMPAGALVSATMLLPMLKRYKISPERLTVINYWFRHVWTTVWPLYPSVIIALAVLGKDYAHYALIVFPISLFSFLAGFMLLTGLETSFKPQNLKVGIKPLDLIFSLLVIYIIIGRLIIAVLISITALLIDKRPGQSDLKELLPKALDPKLIILVFAVMGYKNIVEDCDLAKEFSEEFADLPIQLLIFFLAFFIGFSTGIELSYSSIALPVFLNAVEDPVNLLLLILGGFIGVILSPFHLCFVLTVEFFKANMYKCYLIILKPVIVLILLTVILLLLQ
ncbi:MAG: DUF401 family protein [Archaeoglobaceae archaeon]